MSPVSKKRKSNKKKKNPRGMGKDEQIKYVCLRLFLCAINVLLSMSFSPLFRFLPHERNVMGVTPAFLLR